ncbi:endonuclease/exonuclease/phosphatase family protein [Sanguibacter massiliensis]|uniref:endonuclease/exonuclease/phosphatase family protein n=1 Tax=Sanguibacter massiliensis TaxID=1973217 RepID=UPI000C84D981|nr:endonuclease/exonuclease/phosphatase family protein [Sanguibacter massiliensis]
MVDAPTRPLARTALLMLVTALTVELVRATGPMLDRAFSAGVIVVALTALGTYVAPGLVTLAVAWLRPVTGRTVLAGVVLLALARVAVQATGGVPRYWLTLGAASVAVSVLALTVSLVAGDGDGDRAGSRRAALATATGVGVAAVVSVALGTWDAPWRPGLDGWLPTLLVAGAALGCAWRLRDAGPSATPRRMWMLGPYLAVMIMVLGNPAYLSSQLGIPFDAAGVGVGLGLFVAGGWFLLPGIGAVDARSRGRSIASVVIAVALVVAAVLVLFPTQPVNDVVSDAPRWIAIVTIPVLWSATTYGLSVAWSVPLAQRAPVRAGLLRAGSATAVGLGLILPLLVYQLDYDVPLGFPNQLVILAAFCALAVAGVRRPASGPVPAPAPAPAPADLPEAAARTAPRVVPEQMLSGVVAIVLVGVVSFYARVPAIAPAIDKLPGTVRILDWNLHYGVTQDPGLGLGRMAEAIRGSGAQVVALQEVSRGWVMGGGADMLTYLEHVTGFRAVAAPAADRQFVNALLIDPALLGDDGEVGAEERVVRTRLPYGDGPQWRSAITATIDVPGPDGDVVPLVITSAHLQHREENTPTRLAQLDVLMAADIASSPAAIIAGDLNSEPGWAEIDHVTSRGFVSGQDPAGDPSLLTFPAWDPEVRIDWIFGRGVTFTDVQVMPDDGSDHRGILADIDLAAVEATASE